MVPPELLQLNKRVVHRQMDAMGLRAGIRAGTELCALGTHTKAMREFIGDAREKGLTNALQERDAPFGDYRTRSRRVRWARSEPGPPSHFFFGSSQVATTAGGEPGAPSRGRTLRTPLRAQASRSRRTIPAARC